MADSKGHAIGFRKRNAEQAAERLYRFYSGQLGDEILATLDYPCPELCQEPIVVPQADDETVCEREALPLRDLPLLLAMYRRRARAAFENPDDSLLTVIPVVDFEGAIETAMLGGRARWMGTRLHTWGEPAEPLISNYEEFHWRLPEESNEWLQRYLECYRYMVRHANNDFALAFSAEFTGLNLVVQLRGAEEAYLDLYDCPDDVQRLLQYSYDLMLYLYARVEEIVGAYNLALYGNHSLSEYRVDHQPNHSVDAYSICRPGTLRQFGMSQIARFIRAVGGGNLHIHQNGRHVIEEVVEIPGWREVRFTDGPGWPLSFDMRWELRRRLRDIPMVIRCTEMQFMKGMQERDLPCNTRYVLSVASLEEAKRVMDRVHAYRAPVRGSA